MIMWLVKINIFSICPSTFKSLHFIWLFLVLCFSLSVLLSPLYSVTAFEWFLGMWFLFYFFMVSSFVKTLFLLLSFSEETPNFDPLQIFEFCQYQMANCLPFFKRTISLAIYNPENSLKENTIFIFCSFSQWLV